MHLITMAHIGEAQALIDQFNLQKMSTKFFAGKNFNLLLTGEGPFEAAANVALELGRSTYKKVINIGIAGSLSGLPTKSIHEVRSIYLVQDGKPLYKSFPLQKDGIDLITSFERILNPEKTIPLKGIGEMIDREAWGIAFSCKQANVPLVVWKIISDEAGEIDSCKVRNNSEEYSLLIVNKVKEILLTKNESTEDFIELDGFWRTHSTNIQLTHGIKALALRDGLSIDEVIKQLPIKDLLEENILPKERTKKLLKNIDSKLDPLKDKITTSLFDLKSPFTSEEIQINFDPSLETSEIKIQLSASDSNELNRRLELLKSFNFKNLEEIRQGKFHVE